MTEHTEAPKPLRQWRRQPMTVGELIDALKRHDPDMPVVVDGYENGYDSLTADSIDVAAIVPDAAKADEPWLGDHQRPEALPVDAGVDGGWGAVLADSYTADASVAASVRALLLSRGDKTPRTLTPALRG